MVNKPVVNFYKRKTIFAPKLVHDRQLFEPCILTKEINYLGDNPADGRKYTKMATSERRT
jgi:hypothetical protein